MSLLETFARQTYIAQEQQRAKREQVAENSARQAFFTTEHRLTGTGSMSVKQPVMFDTTFIERPAFAFGPEIVKLDQDLRHWRYPVGSAGVWKWVTEPTPEAKAAKAVAVAEMERAAVGASGVSAVNALDNSAVYADDELLYKGAYLYFVVVVDPLMRPRSDGSDLADLQAQLTHATGPDATKLQKLIAEAQEALWLNAHPPKPVMNFSLTFFGMALKTVSDTVIDGLHSDPSLTPRNSA